MNGNKIQYTLTVEHYAEIKRIKLLIYGTALMSLKMLYKLKRIRYKDYILYDPCMEFPEKANLQTEFRTMLPVSKGGNSDD